MIKPPLLTTGAKVALVAPGRKIKREDVEASKRIIESWGLEVEVAKNIYSEKHSYLAGTDSERLEDFQSMVDDENIRAIICARGGYGSTRIVDALDFSSFQSNPKWIVGFSDITAIHLKLLSMGCLGIHGTMPILFSKGESAESVESLRQVLWGDHRIITAKNYKENKLGKTTGQMLGGNLSLFVDSLGTNSEPDTSEKILILEETDEYLYKIDRMFVQLKRAGKLNNLAGLVLGYFTDTKDTDLNFGEQIKDIVLRVTADYSYPLAFGFPIGHENPNVAWVYGDYSTLLVDSTFSKLTME